MYDTKSHTTRTNELRAMPISLEVTTPHFRGPWYSILLTELPYGHTCLVLSGTPCGDKLFTFQGSPYHTLLRVSFMKDVEIVVAINEDEDIELSISEPTSCLCRSRHIPLLIHRSFACMYSVFPLLYNGSFRS